jgi:alkanesulfonate monooxygenase SsuD/methylene tetrahydromethanopterin reductase-like flavin-dependent oxidoreductase (luciferase family)
MRRKAFVGTATQVGAQMRALAQELQLDEIVINTWAHDPVARRTSYALIAGEFGLGNGTAGTAAGERGVGAEPCN